MRNASATIGIDVGGTKIAGALVTADGGVAAEHRIRTFSKPGTDDSFARATSLAAGLARTADQRRIAVIAVGVGVPELVDVTGRLETACAVDWRRRDVRATFGAIGPTLVESDVRAAAAAEARFGHGRTYPSLLYVSIGTGISSSIVSDGQVWRGAHGTAILLGGVEISRGLILEDHASGAALARRSGRSATELVRAAAAGDAAAHELLREAGDRVGRVLAIVVNLLDPGAVVVGGGLGVARGPYRDALRAAIQAGLWDSSHQSVTVLQSSLGARASVIGVAMLARAMVSAGDCTDATVPKPRFG